MRVVASVTQGSQRQYDAFTNNYLEPAGTNRSPKIAWADTAVGRTLKTFWASLKALSTKGLIQRIFITGISPLSLSSLGSAFNVARNLSFHRDLAGLRGLAHLDLEDALNAIRENLATDSNSLSEMTKYFNGYHFCNDQAVNSVFNTETCLVYLQCLVEGVKPETKEPENSEVSEQFLRLVASGPVARDFETALNYDENGDFTPLKYDRFKPHFTLQDLVC